MAYNPPFSGGHFNASVSGNTSGTPALVSSGTLTIAGGNNITLSQNNNAITIVGANPTSPNINFYGTGNTTQNSSTQVIGSALTFDGLGIMSVGYSNGSIQLSASTSQSAQTQSNVQAVSLSGNTSGVLSNISTGTLYLAGGNNITLSQSNNSVTISAPNQSVSMYARGNTTSSSAGVFNATNFNISGAGAASIGVTGQSLIVSAPVQSLQTSNVVQAVSLSGNTSGVLSNVNTGTLYLAGGNNITLSQSNNSVTISGAGGGGGGIGLAASNSTYTSGTVNLSNAGGALTLSPSGQTINLSVAQTSSLVGTGAVSLSANGSTISVGAPNQTNQSMGMYAAGNTTQNSSTTLDARSLSFNGAGNVSVGYSNGSIQISGAGGGGGGIGLAASNSTYTSGTVNLSNAGGALTLMPSGQNINVSVAQTSSLSATGAVSISTTGQTINIGAPAQTNQTVGMYALGHTTQNSSTTLDARSLSFNGLGNVSVGYSNGSIQISGAGGGGGGGGVGIVAGASSYTSGTVTLSNGGGALTITPSGSSINLSVPSASSLVGAGAMTISTSGSTMSLSVPQASSLAASGAMTIGAAGQTLNLSVPGTSVISGLGAISISTTGSTINISAPTASTGAAGGTISNWEPMPINQAGLTAVAMSANTLSFFPLQVPTNVSATQAMNLVSGSFSTSSNANYTGAISLMFGIYTAGTASSLQLITQSSGLGTYSFSMSSSNSISLMSGMKGMTVPVNLNLSAGNYWMGILYKTSGTSFTMSNMVAGTYGFNQTAAYNGFLGASSNVTQGIQEAVGYFNVTETTLPATAAMSQITQSKPFSMPYFIFKNIGW